MKRAQGSFSSRAGARWSVAYATTRRRGEAQVAQHATASPAEAVIAPSQEAMRAAIEAETCPFCGAGPYKNLGLHTRLAHAVSAVELREMSGLRRVCSEDLSNDSRNRLINRADFAEVTARATQASVQAGAHLRARDVSLEQRESIKAERDPRIATRAQEPGATLSGIARDFGLNPVSVRRILQEQGVAIPMTQTNAERRQRLESYRDAARATRDQRLAEDRDRRLRRFVELGGDWKAVEALAVECEISERVMRAYLRKAGAEVPDGRAVSHRRPKERPDLRGKPNLACRAVTAEQMAEIRRLSRETSLSQREIGERLGVSQSIISRVVLGKYIGEGA